MRRDELEQEIVYGRDADNARIFVSSKMDGSLDRERKYTVEAIENLPGHKAWWWERDAATGVLHSVEECVRYARTSDGLVLLIGGALSEIIYQEYGAARGAGAEVYVFIKQGVDRPEDVDEFIKRERAQIVTRNFRNANELATLVRVALKKTAVRAIREMVLARKRMRVVSGNE